MNYIYKCPCGYTYNENISNDFRCTNCSRLKSEFEKGYFVAETEDVYLEFPVDEPSTQQVFIGLQNSEGNIIQNLKNTDSNI